MFQLILSPSVVHQTNFPCYSSEWLLISCLLYTAWVLFGDKNPDSDHLILGKMWKPTQLQNWNASYIKMFPGLATCKKLFPATMFLAFRLTGNGRVMANKAPSLLSTSMQSFCTTQRLCNISPIKGNMQNNVICNEKKIQNVNFCVQLCGVLGGGIPGMIIQ